MGRWDGLAVRTVKDQPLDRCQVKLPGVRLILPATRQPVESKSPTDRSNEPDKDEAPRAGVKSARFCARCMLRGIVISRFARS